MAYSGIQVTLEDATAAAAELMELDEALTKLAGPCELAAET